MLPEAEILFRSHHWVDPLAGDPRLGIPSGYPKLSEALAAGEMLVARPDDVMVATYPCGKGFGWIASPVGEVVTARWKGKPYALLRITGLYNPLAPAIERLPWPLVLVDESIWDGESIFVRTDGWCKATAVGWRAFFAWRRRYTAFCLWVGRHVVRLPWVQYPEGERFSWSLLLFALAGGKPRAWYAWQNRKASRIVDRLLKRGPSLRERRRR